jgi:N,N'-diacetyllegionaminate synthase
VALQHKASDRVLYMNQEIIVELGNVHEGSVGIAKSLIDMVALTGADIVKFQMHLAEFEGIPAEPFRVKFSDQDATRSEYWNRVNFSKNNWRLLSEYAISKGLEFLCTPFSIQAAQSLLENTGIKRWKLGSGDASNFPLIDFLADTKLPMIISTGLVSESEIEKLVLRLEKLGIKESTVLMHCVSQYPTPLEKSSLHLIDYLKSTGCKVGLSDHSGMLATALYGLSRGIEILEIHLTPHEHFFGPDISSSLETHQIQSIVEFRDSLKLMQSSDLLTRDDLYAEAESIRTIFRKGIYWSHDLEPGHVVALNDLAFLKPCTAIDAMDFEHVLGKRLTSKVSAKNPVDWNDLDD